MRILSIIAAVAISSIVLYATPDNYYGKSKEGWYSYEKDPLPEQNATIKKRFILTPENLSRLSGKQFKELFEAAKDEAVMRPSPESLRSYIILQNFSVSQAEKFQKQFRAETLKDATLDLSSGFNTSTFAHGVDIRMQEEKRKTFFEKNKDRAGFIVFFDSKESPEKMKAQKEVADYFESENHMKTIFVDLQANPGLKQANKIAATPDVWFVIKQNDGSTFRSRVATGVSDRKSILEGIDFVTDQYLENNKASVSR